MTPKPNTTVFPAGYKGFAQPCQTCGHPESAHLAMDAYGPTGLYTRCTVESCTCSKWKTPWPNV